MDDKITIAIIGSASSKQKPEYEIILTKKTWNYMCETTEKYIETKIKSDWSKIILVSGGAAWSDHIAVYLYLKHPESSLNLYFPCKWDYLKKCFKDNGSSHWTINPGRLANFYHNSFTKKIGFNTLEQLHYVIEHGAKVHDEFDGFHARNIAIGLAQFLIAFSFSKDAHPTDGGTVHTWKNSTSTNKIHFSIFN
jgi:hypothetical protein